MMMKKLLAFLLTAAMAFTSVPTAFAAEGSFQDVANGAWYAEAVEYVHTNGIMSGSSADTFSPNDAMTRAMLTTVLYRAAGSPAVNNQSNFADVDTNAYYANAVAWASENGTVNGYSGNTFGVSDAVSREQIAAILYRYAGSPAVAGENNFADKSGISAYAVSAVNWAEQSGIMNGMNGNRFDPKGNATRAQVALILHKYLTLDKNDNTPDTDNAGKALVVYYSASGNTERVAKEIAAAANADLFAVTPVTPYTSDDLDWTAESSRVNREHEDEALRDVALTTTKVENWETYDTVFIGYPIWWGIAAWPVNNFVKDNDFTGKTVIPFATSSSSGMGESGELLKELAGTGSWQNGQRFSSGASENTVKDWVSGLEINQ